MDIEPPRKFVCGGKTIGEQKANCQATFCKFISSYHWREKAAAGLPDKLFGLNRAAK
jgi:hypothetical protein